MKKGQVYEGTVVRVDFPNKGIVCVGEETAVVKNSLPGQKVKFSVNKVRKGKAEGRLLEVTEKSPLETGRTCSLFGLCGGCTYLSLPYEEQLKVKEEQVKRLLDSVLNKQEEPWTFEGIKGSPKAYEYRNKMEFSFGDRDRDPGDGLQRAFPRCVKHPRQQTGRYLQRRNCTVLCKHPRTYAR